MNRRDHSQPVSAATLEARQRRRVASMPSIAFFSALAASAWPVEEPTPRGLGFTALIAVAGGALVYVGVRRQQPFVAMLSVLFCAAYAPGLGDAVVRGVPTDGLRLTPDGASVQQAVLILILFLAALAAGTELAQPLVERMLPAPRQETDSTRQGVWLGLLVVLAIAFVISLATGTWSAYGGDRPDDSRDGSLRMEFFYDPSLFSVFGLATARLGQLYAMPARARGRTRWLWVVVAVVFALMFTRQIRRMMLASLVFGLVVVLDRSALALRVLLSPRKLVLGGVLVATVTAGLFVGSNAWRRSANEFATNSLGDRLADVSSRVGETSSEQLAKDRERLTYLWLDSASVQYEPVLHGALSLGEMFVQSAILVTPGMLLKSKYLYPLTTCETAFMRLGLDNDLPCTPQAEGLIAFGLPGVVIVALTWVPLLALATALFRRGRAMSVVAAMHLILPLTAIETSAFPIALSMRLALLGVSLIGGVALLWKAFGARRLKVLPGRRASVRRRTTA